jgi:hypothetical protein
VHGHRQRTALGGAAVVLTHRLLLLLRALESS